jgi:hypothetical protein
MASENEVRLQLKGGRSIKIIRTETPTGGMWSIPEMPEIAAHQNISVIRDRLRGKGLIASRPGQPERFGGPSGLPVRGLQTPEGYFGVYERKVRAGEDRFEMWFTSHTGDRRSLGTHPSLDGAMKIGEQLKSGKKSFRDFAFSRPGAKATFKVEDRFYFGKGRKERFAITRQPGSCLYANNTGTDVSGYHSAIAKAIEKGGKFDSDFSDVFKLTRSPAGSVCLWSLTWA